MCKMPWFNTLLIEKKIKILFILLGITLTLSFFNNRDSATSTKFCQFIENKDEQSYCLEGLRLEITDSENYKIKPLTETTREKFQPQFESDYVIDISPAIISDFDHIQEIGMITFSIDSPQYIILS